jgi:hypothetical protein
MSIQVSQYINPSEHLTFQFRGEQTVVVACEIWRRTPKGMVRFVDIKPYYKFDIDISVLSKTETDGLFANIQQVKKFGQKAYEKGKTLLNFVMEGNADNTLLGVQIDESSKFGTKVEISFSDYERLLYKIIRTDDIMYLWAINMSKSVAMAGITGGLVSGGSKILLHTYYKNDIKFSLGVREYLRRKGLAVIGDVNVDNGGLVETLCNAGQSEEGMVNKIFKSKKLDRDIPHFGGFITVKNFHIGGSAQTRMNAQDPARMFQHLKINYGFDEENKRKEAKRGIEDYMSNSFWKMIEKTARYCHDKRFITETTRAARANDPDNRGRITGIIDINASTFFRILVDRVYADTRFVESNDKDMLFMAFDKSIKKLFKKTKDKDAKIRFIHTRDNNLAPRKYYLDLNSVNEHVANGTIPLATALIKPLSKGFTSERWSPDELDIYTKPELDANMKSPSLIDFINMWVSNFVYYNSLIYGDVSRNVWVKSNIFINQNGTSLKKGTGTIITLLFTFSGRDNSTGELITSDREHKLFLDEISELDVFEINRRGQVSECLVADEDDVSQSFASCSLAHNLYTDTIYSHKPKIIMFDTVKPLIKFSPQITSTQLPARNLARVLDSESYFPELKDSVDNILGDDVKGFLSKSFAKSENLRIAERLKLLGITPNKQFKIRLNFSATIQKLLNFAGDNRATELSLNYGGTRPFIIKDEYQFNDFFEQCQAFLTSSNMFDMGKKYLRVRAELGLGTSSKQVKYTSLSGRNLTLLQAAVKKIFTFLDEDNIKLNQVIINALSYDKSDIDNVSFNNNDAGWRNQFANPVITLKGYLLRLIFVAIELAVETVRIFLHDLANTSGRNGSLYLASHPEIQVGDTLYLVEDQSNILSLADRLLTKNYPTVGNIVRNASALIGNTKPLMSAIKSKDPITKKGRKEKEYFEKDLQSNGEGKIFVDDVALLTDPEGKKIPRWFVYRHVMYIGNFGSTSGFMSKIYMVDEPLNSNMPFDEDNVVTRQLSTFLHQTRLADGGPLSWQRG